MLIAGVDEAGRGPLAGPIIAAAVILDKSIYGLNDSKKLSHMKRVDLCNIIKSSALSFGVGRCEAHEIDALNIHEATLLAMKRAITQLSHTPERVLVDGKFCPDIELPCQAIIGGDASEPCISAASIVAKVHRDEEMILLDRQFPQYGFAQHKGYPTAAHRDALKAHGPCTIHRKSYKPVAKYSEIEQ